MREQWGVRFVSNFKDNGSDFKLSERATLDLLAALEDEGVISQRGLAERIGVALGLTNTLLKRAVRKGLIKVGQVPAKRYAYYVTPKGFSEKSRLVADYLASSLDFFRIARSQYVSLLREASESGCCRVYLYGSGELAEIASLSATEADVKIVGILEPGANHSEFSGHPVFPSLDQISHETPCAVIITDSGAPQSAYENLLGHLPENRIYTAPFLHVSRSDRGRK